MQGRLLRSFLGIALVMILGLGVPLGVVASRLVTDQAHERLQREADAIELGVEAEREGAPLSVAEIRPFLAPSSQAEIRYPDGRVVPLGPASVGPDPVSVSSVTDSGVQIVVRSPGGPTHDRLVEVWAVVALVAAGALAIAGFVAVAQARRLARPLVDLAAAAGRLGAGEFPVVFPAVGIAEVDAVADQLGVSSERLAAQLERERSFSANASHQLRTALTALRLRLEELPHAEGPEERDAELAAVARQTDRLEATIEELLAFARAGGTTPLDLVRLDDVVDERAGAWQPVFARAGRSLTVVAPSGAAALGSPGAVGQTLDVLLDNAMRHGAGTVRVTVDGEGSPVVRVTDEGPGILAGAEARIFERGVTGTAGTGIGLALARELIESIGGRLVLARPRPPVFEIFLTPVTPTAGPPIVGRPSP